MKDNTTDGNFPLPPQSSHEGRQGISRNARKNGASNSGKPVLQLFRNEGKTADSASGTPVAKTSIGRPPKIGPRRGQGARADETDAGLSYSGSDFEVEEEFADADTQESVLTAFPAASPYRDQWNALQLVSADMRQHFLTGKPLVDYFRDDPAAHAVDQLRTRMLQTLRSNGWNRVAVASPTQGCGTTFTAVNLAQSLARVPNSRNVLMDLNNRTPGVAGMLDIDNVGNIRGYLAGDVSMVRHLLRVSETLALGLTDGTDQNAAEMLLDVRCGPTLDRLNAALRPDVILYDLPPILVYDDLVAFLPHVDAVLLVADGTQTQANQIRECKRLLEGKTQMLGVILNRTRVLGAVGDEDSNHLQ